MNHTVSVAEAVAVPRARADVRWAAIPWYLWGPVIGVTSGIVGSQWDIAWHRSIGRDTFWTPAHIAIYLDGILAALCFGYLIVATTIGQATRATAVNIWGFAAPLGAFIGAWGGVAMLTSAPFDDWWHNAYGLDVKIISPPHMVLVLGMVGIELGAMILVLGFMNRAQGALRERLEGLYVYLGGLSIAGKMTVLLEYTPRPFMHGARFYLLVGLVVLPVMVAVARAVNRRWACTTQTAVYSIMVIGLLWILPLFPAEPKLGPVYTPVRHFIPAEFPILVIAPALVIDGVWGFTAAWTKWGRAALFGVLFVAVFLAAQWPFADFLMSPFSRNWVFGTHYHSYFVRPTSMYYRNLYVPTEATAGAFWLRMGIATVTAIIAARAGLALGDWMRRIRR